MPVSNNNRSLGIQKNKLLRYKLIKELYEETVKLHPHTPVTKVLKIYIFPKYPISRTTLYEVLATPIIAELKKIEEQERQYLAAQKTQTSLFQD